MIFYIIFKYYYYNNKNIFFIQNQLNQRIIKLKY